MSWRVSVRRVRPCNGALRWVLVACDEDVRTFVTVDTSLSGGAVLGIQSDGWLGTSGDVGLDDAALECVAGHLGSRDVARALDRADFARWGRVQTSRDRDTWAV